MTMCNCKIQTKFGVMPANHRYVK